MGSPCSIRFDLDLSLRQMLRTAKATTRVDRDAEAIKRSLVAVHVILYTPAHDQCDLIQLPGSPFRFQSKDLAGSGSVGFCLAVEAEQESQEVLSIRRERSAPSEHHGSKN